MTRPALTHQTRSASGAGKPRPAVRRRGASAVYYTRKGDRDFDARVAAASAAARTPGPGGACDRTAASRGTSALPTAQIVAPARRSGDAGHTPMTPRE